MIKKLLIIFFVLPVCLFAKTLVFTTAFNRPDFIELQHQLFEKFLEDDYEFWVISDANTDENRQNILKTCDRLGIRCYQVPQEIHDQGYLPRQPGDNFHNPNVRHCNSVQWAWNNFISRHDGPVMLIDSDMFLIRPFSVEKKLAENQLAGVLWGTEDAETGKPYSYLWLALILFDNPSLPEKETLCFNCGYLPGTKAVCDSGGYTYFYLNKYKDEVKVLPFSFLQGHHFFCPYRYAPENVQNFSEVSMDEIILNLTRRGFSEAEIRLALKKPYTIELLADNHFLHYRAGTNYENYSNQFITEKDKILREFFDDLLRN